MEPRHKFNGAACDRCRKPMLTGEEYQTLSTPAGSGETEENGPMLTLGAAHVACLRPEERLPPPPSAQ